MIDRARARQSLRRETERWFGAVAVAVAGLACLLVAQARGAAGWLVGAYALLAVLGLVAYRALVVPSLRELDARRAATAVAEERLGSALAHLHHGDLVRAEGVGGGVAGEAGVALVGAVGALEVIGRRIQVSSTDVAAAATAVNRIAAELAS